MKLTFTKAACKLIFCLLLVAPFLTYSQSTTNFDVEVGSADYNMGKVMALSGNRVGVLVMDYTSGNLYLWIYNAAGTRTANIDITARLNWQHSYHYNVNTTSMVTSDGNIFIAYVATSNSTGFNNFNARYVLINDLGLSLASGQLNSTDAGASYIFSILLDQLSDGKIVAVWKRSANDNLGFRLFNLNGSAFANDVYFAGPGTANSSITNSYNSTMKIAAGKAGNFMISTLYANSDLRGFVYDNTGANATSGGAASFSVDPTIDYNYGNNGLVALANGNFLASWSVAGVNYQKIITNNGSTVVNKVSMPQTNITGVLPLYTSGTEGYVVTEPVPQDPNNGNNPYSTMWFHRYNQSGVLQASTAGVEGALIQPSYSFISGRSGGFAYLYSYYKSYAVDAEMGGYYPQGDRDTRGVTNGLSMSTLPVSLVSYDATVLSNGKAFLKWSTSAETNSSHFEIEKSTDGLHFTALGSVKANGNTRGPANYSFTTNEPVSQTTFFRLNQFDLDGRSRELGVRVVSISGKTLAIYAYPNPLAGNSLNIVTGNEPLPAQYQLTDETGRIVKSGVLQQAHEQLKLQELNHGIYFLRVGKQVIRINK